MYIYWWNSVHPGLATQNGMYINRVFHITDNSYIVCAANCQNAILFPKLLFLRLQGSFKVEFVGKQFMRYKWEEKTYILNLMMTYRLSLSNWYDLWHSLASYLQVQVICCRGAVEKITSPNICTNYDKMVLIRSLPHQPR